MTKRVGGSLIVVALAAGRVGVAQKGVAPVGLEDHLYAYAAEFEQKLPSLNCHESIRVEDLKKGEVTRTTRFEGTIRVVRTGAEKEPFAEEHTFLTRDGAAIGGKVSISYWVTGGFAHGMGFSRPETAACYVVTAGAGGMRVEVARRPGSEELAVCKERSLPGLRRTVLLDEAGHVVHVERTLPDDVARSHKEASFAATDYAPVALGAESLWLPVRMESHDPKDEHRLEVRYSGCQRYAGSMKILEGVQPVP